MLVFLPIFGFDGVEKKMFSPMAFSICFALFGSLITAIVFAPVFSSYLIQKKKHKEFFLLTKLKAIYSPLLIRAIDRKRTVVLISLVAFLSSLALLPLLGTEFIPTLEEGSILIGVTMAPSISLEKGTEIAGE